MRTDSIFLQEILSEAVPLTVTDLEEPSVIANSTRMRKTDKKGFFNDNRVFSKYFQR
jgi:hypothetical protein